MGTYRRTKIVATIGPASQDSAALRGVIGAGADVLRLNLSHGTLEEHSRRLEAIRQVAQESPRPVAVLADLPGPKLRIGPLPGGALQLEQGDEVRLVEGDDSPPPEVTGTISVAYPGLADDVRPGDRISLQDGEIGLSVLQAIPGLVRCAVEAGGLLRERVGLNVPGVRLGLPALTDYDLRCLEWGVAGGVDYIGLSFVEGPDEILSVRERIRSLEGTAGIVAKIERRRALDRIEEIVRAADAVMVARGDLAVETSIEEVPVVQKRIIGLCNAHGRPVVTATQMLESMVSRPRPTRAEAADVANAVFDGTDALMLSAETAIGSYPVAAVATMASVASAADAALPYDHLLDARGREQTDEVSGAIALAACEAAEAIGAAAIVAATESGSTARRVSRLRPRRPVVAVTPNPVTWRQLALVWGVRAVLTDQVEDLEELIDGGGRAAVALGDAAVGDLVVVTAGVPIMQPGTTNFLKVVRVEGRHVEGGK